MRRVRRLFRIGSVRPGIERDLEEELDFHFGKAVSALVEEGMDPDEARREADRRFGDRRRYRRALERIALRAARTTRRRERMDAMRQALGFSMRGLRRSPGFAAAVIVTLALGIGANATMFSVADRLLLSPPDHVERPDRVARLLVERISPFTARPVVSSALAWPDYTDFEQVDAFQAVAAYGNRTMTLGSGPDAERVRVQWAGEGMFELLGVGPHRGHFFGPEEVGMDPRTRAAVLAHGFWLRRFGEAPDILGTEIHVGAGRYTVVGVAPPGFTGPTMAPVDLWLPLLLAAVAEQGRAWVDARRWYWLAAVARLRDGVTPEAAREEATAAHRAGRAGEVALDRYDPQAAVTLGSLVPGRGPEPGAEVEVSRWLVGVSVLVLLIACANVTNLLLARAVRRRRELAVRLALGLGRRRLLGHLLLESVVLAGLAGAAALAVARWGGAAVYRTFLPEVDPGGALSGPRLLLFTGATVLLAAGLAGLVPAVRASRPDVTLDLKDGARGATSSTRLRTGLLVLQVSLSVVLLVGAGLFVRSLRGVRALELGFEADGVVYGTVQTGEGTFNRSSSEAVIRAAERLRPSPGVQEVAVTSLVPFRGVWGRTLLLPPGDTVPFERGPYYYVVSSGYFDVMGMRIVRGRGFQPEDEAAAAEPVAVITRDLARRLFGPSEAVGRCVLVEQSEGPPPCTRVVGVLADHRFASTNALDDPESPIFYLPPSHPASAGTPPQTLVARSSGPAADLVPAVRRALLEGGADVRYASTATLSSVLDEETRSWRLGATLFLVFGGLALAVALVGLYALVAFDVVQRRTDLGIRAALGAPAHRLAGMVVRRALGLVGVGLVLGLAVALAAGPSMTHLLFRVRPGDPPTLAAVAASLLAVAGLAALLPALRAARVDPTDALRSE